MALERGSDNSGTEAGFTLIEILVALAIVSVALGVAYDVITTGLHRTAHAERTAEAVLLAQSVLAAAGTEMPLQDGQIDRQLPNGFRWRLRIEPFGDAGDRQVWPVAAYQVTALIEWDEGTHKKSVRLTTLRLGPKAPTR